MTVRPDLSPKSLVRFKFVLDVLDVLDDDANWALEGQRWQQLESTAAETAIYTCYAFQNTSESSVLDPVGEIPPKMMALEIVAHLLMAKPNLNRFSTGRYTRSYRDTSVYRCRCNAGPSAEHENCGTW